MTAPTHPEFNDKTEALEVAKAFADVLKGKTVIVTGVNLEGIGFVTAQAFASQGAAHLIVAGRDINKVKVSIDRLKKDYPNVDYRALVLDLSSQKAVRKAADEVLSWSDIPEVNILVNNAGVMNVPERTLSEDGIEIQLATNHIGHFLFTNLIMPKLLKAAASSPKGATRVVNVSSSAANAGGMRWSDINFEQKSFELPDDERPDYDFCKNWGFPDPANLSYIPQMAYTQSKAANVLFGIGLTKRLYDSHGVLGLALHPGVIRTELGRYMKPEQRARVLKMVEQGLFSFKSQAAGGATSLVAALDPALGPDGPFLSDCQLGSAHPRAMSSSEAEKLWPLSEKLVKQTFSYGAQGKHQL